LTAHQFGGLRFGNDPLAWRVARIPCRQWLCGGWAEHSTVLSRWPLR
jgi:hypothetical protein